MNQPATFYALAAIAMWATLAASSLLLAHVPPFLLTGIALLVGSVLTWPAVAKDRTAWRVSWPVLALGVLTLFGFHFFLFMALRAAPAVEVNLVNYLWPLLMVLLSPFYLPGDRLRVQHGLAALMGFAGAALAILGNRQPQDVASANPAMGYALALASALLWANYSLQTKRLALAGRSFPSSAIGLFGLVAGMLSLVCHAALETRVSLSLRDAGLLLLMGLGPLGAAFLLWDKALKIGDARQIGILSYLTPLASTLLLMAVTQRTMSWHIGVATALVIGAAWLGSRRMCRM